jgi:hypothetical protein
MYRDAVQVFQISFYVLPQVTLRDSPAVCVGLFLHHPDDGCPMTDEITRVVDLMLRDPIASREIDGFRKRLQTATSIEEIRWLEGQAAISYFGAMRGVPVLGPKVDLARIPDHWRSVGNR